MTWNFFKLGYKKWQEWVQKGNAPTKSYPDKNLPATPSKPEPKDDIKIGPS